MQIQFDPLSFVVAALALSVSVRAHYLAKKAPHLERVRRTQDRVRTALRELEPSFREVAFRLDGGQLIGEAPTELATAYAVLEECVPRLPEQADLYRLEQALFRVQSKWNSVAHSEKMLAHADEEINAWEERLADSAEEGDRREAARTGLTRARQSHSQAQRAVDSARVALREDLSAARSLSTAYIGTVDEQDRRQAS